MVGVIDIHIMIKQIFFCLDKAARSHHFKHDFITWYKHTVWNSIPIVLIKFIAFSDFICFDKIIIFKFNINIFILISFGSLDLIF